MSENTQVKANETNAAQTPKTTLTDSAKSVAESAKKIVTASKDPVKASHALFILLVVLIIAVGLTRAITISQVYRKAKDGKRQHFFGDEKATFVLDSDGDGFVALEGPARNNAGSTVDGILQK